MALDAAAVADEVIGRKRTVSQVQVPMAAGRIQHDVGGERFDRAGDLDAAGAGEAEREIVRLDLDDPRPPYQQVAASLRA